MTSPFPSTTKNPIGYYEQLGWPEALALLLLAYAIFG